MTGLWQFITGFGDLAVVIPVIATLCAGLWLAGWRRAALACGGTTCAVLALMLVLKLAFLSHVLPEAAAGLRNPSGHTAAATVAGGSIVGLLAARRQHALFITILCTIAIAALIGLSRVVLGEHSLGDVLLAGPIGIGAAAAVRVLAGPPPAGFRPARPVLAALAVAAAMHGAQLKVEKTIENLAAGKPWTMAKALPIMTTESF